MKISIQWLRELTGNPSLDGAQVAERLTRAGLEVESRKKIGDFSGVIVAEVRGKRPHPDAQKLTLVDVFDGKETTQVVCGAPNVPEVGWKVLWARPGARVPMGEGGAQIELGKKAVRGIESPGMLCAEDELGLGESHAGILTIAPSDPLQPGDDAAKALRFPDEILELAVGPNRPDCLGHIGVARELGTGTRSTPASQRDHAASETKRHLASGPTVRIDDPDGCPRYSATLIEGVTVGPSPLQLRLRLQALGVRAISNVVDMTNLVMLRDGQPLHAFDLDTLPGPAIIVRRARAGETIETLDGVTRPLVPTDLLICAGGDRPIALAGVMGGKATEVTDKTRRILLECAAFSPSAIRATAKRLGLPSEASHRFERGVDPNGVPRVAGAASAELAALAGGEIVAAAETVARVIEPSRLVLRAARARLLTGLDQLTVERQAALLSGIGIACEIAGDELRATVPTFRPDLTREVDLVEEVLRLEGYEQVPSTIPPLRAAPPELKHRLADRARDLLSALGLDEAITYAFVGPAELAAFELAAPRDRALRIANPLREEQSAMRTTLVAGLVKAAARNVARGVTDVRLFEVGQIFIPQKADSLPDERRHAAGILVGRRDAWLKDAEPLDYFDLRGLVDELGQGLGQPFAVVASREPWLHPGVQGAITIGDGQVVGHLGELHPRIAEGAGLEARALVFELDLGALPKRPPPPLQPIPRFPTMERDVSFLVDASRTAAEIARLLADQNEPLLVGARPREDYRDPAHVPPGKKSMLWSLTYRATDRTLTDAEVRAAHERLLAALTKATQAQLR